jgi:hypothetical protein
LTSVDFDRIGAEALAAVDYLVPKWLPEGYVEGPYWVALNPRRADKTAGSFKIHLRDGGWKDWAGGDHDKGGDLIALRAYLDDCKQSEAAERIADELLLPREETPAVQAAKRGNATGRNEWLQEWEILSPVPTDAPDWHEILTHSKFGTATKHWPVLDAAGRITCYEVRYWDKARDRKECRYWVCAKHRRTGFLRWSSRWPAKPWPIYGLAELARRPDAPVVVVEGPKSGDAAMHLLPGYVVCSPLGGSENAKHCDWQPLTGRDVVVLPDVDEAGSKVVDAVRKVVDPCGVVDAGAVFALLTAEPGDPPQGWDVADIPDDQQVPHTLLAALLASSAQSASTPTGDAAPPQTPPPGDGGGDSGGGGSGDGGDTPRGLFGKRYRKLRGGVEAYLEKHGLTVDGLGAWRRKQDWELQTATVETITRLFLDEFREQAPANAGNVGEVLDAIVSKCAQARREELIGRIIGHPRTVEGDQALRTWVMAVSGSDADLYVEAMRHWIWLVKRRLSWKRTEFDIMPVLFGKHQGSGKTTAVEKLCAPLAELVIADLNVSYFQDERKVPVLAEAAIGVWDEMAGSGKADIQSLKHAITANEIAYRPMKTTKHAPLRRLCSFIGTSNDPVSSIIADTTGARRFVEIPTPERCDWDAINALNMDLVWQCVSEDDHAPAGDIMPLLKAHQGELVHEDAISLWLSSETWDIVEFRLADVRTPLRIPAYDSEIGEHRDHIMARFKHWCGLVGQNPLGTRTVFQRLRQEGFTQSQVPVAGNRERRWFIPAREWSRVTSYTFADDDEGRSETATAQAGSPRSTDTDGGSSDGQPSW